MRAAIFHEPRRIEAGDRPDPTLREPTDAIVRVVIACVCGSDLWYYRGDSEFEPGPIGHEFVGVVEDIGTEVTDIKKGELVIAPFAYSDGTCPNCQNGITTACMNGGFFPMNGDGGQGEAVRVPLADTTLVPVPGSGHSDAMMRSLLTLSDVMATGHHAAVCAQVRAGQTVAVVGDGAVGLSGVLAAERLGAERIIALSRHADRQELAKELGATDIVAERGEAAVEAVKEMTGGVGADATLECVGTGQAMQTAIDIARAGSMVGFVGVPHGSCRSSRCSSAPSACAAAAPPCASTCPSCSTTCSPSASTPAASSTTRPTSTASATPTPRWTSAARSSRSSASGRSDPWARHPPACSSSARRHDRPPRRRRRRAPRAPRHRARPPAQAERILPGVEVAQGDLEQQASLAAAVRDVGAIVFTHGGPGSPDSAHRIDYGVANVLQALDGAKPRIALMTSIGVSRRESPNSGVGQLLDWKRRSERLVRASGARYTIIRPGGRFAALAPDPHGALDSAADPATLPSLDDEPSSLSYQRTVRDLLDTRRVELVRLRDTGEISDEVMHALMRELDLEDQRLEI